MANSEFWRDLAAQFLALPSPRSMLRADGYYVIGSGAPWTWELKGGASGLLCSAFDTLARRGASELANVDISDLLVVWLEALRQDGYGFRLTAPTTEIHEDGSEGPHYLRGCIDCLCEASAHLCNTLESDAIQTESKEKQRNDPKRWP